MSKSPDSKPLTPATLQAFFLDSVNDAIRNQQVETCEATIWYLSHLLSDYARSERLFDTTEEGVMLRPLAELYALASEAPSETERKLILQRLGDVALFVSGLFSGLFTRRRRLVDVDYYMAMGGGAYAYLGESPPGSVRDRSLTEIFLDLSGQFSRFVDVLAEVGEQAFGARDTDLLRIHDLWLKTDSPRLAGKLRAAGIEPVRPGGVH